MVWPDSLTTPDKGILAGPESARLKYIFCINLTLFDINTMSNPDDRAGLVWSDQFAYWDQMLGSRWFGPTHLPQVGSILVGPGWIGWAGSG